MYATGTLKGSYVTAKLKWSKSEKKMLCTKSKFLRIEHDPSDFTHICTYGMNLHEYRLDRRSAVLVRKLRAIVFDYRVLLIHLFRIQYLIQVPENGISNGSVQNCRLFRIEVSDGGGPVTTGRITSGFTTGLYKSTI